MCTTLINIIVLPTHSRLPRERVHMVIKTGSDVEKSGWMYCKFELFVSHSPSKAFSSLLGKCYCITFHSAVEVHWLSFVFSRCVREARERDTEKLKAPHDVNFWGLRTEAYVTSFRPLVLLFKLNASFLQLSAMLRVMSAGTFVGHDNIEHEFAVAAIKKHAKTRS